MMLKHKHRDYQINENSLKFVDSPWGVKCLEYREHFLLEISLTKTDGASK